MDTGNDYTEWILDTIDQLRKRKARPDLERICHMVERKHKASFADIAAELDKLVENQVVVKVDYKGSISYRNAAKWRKSHFGNVQNSSTASAKLETAVRSLTGLLDDDSHDEGAAEDGGERLSEASAADIARWLLERDPDTKLVSDALQVALDREVEAYNLERTEDGNYIIGDPNKKPPPPEKGDKGKNGGGKPRSKSKAKKAATGDGENPPVSDQAETPKKSKKKQQSNPPPSAGGDAGQKVEMKKEDKIDAPVEPVAPKQSKISTTQAQIQQILSTMKPEPPKPKKVEEPNEEDVEKEDKKSKKVSTESTSVVNSPMKSKKVSVESTSVVSSPLKSPSKKHARPASGKRKVREMLFSLYELGQQ